jgi:hypothetical protein
MGRHSASLVGAAYGTAFHHGDISLQELASQAIVSDLNLFYRIFIRLSSPDSVIQRVASRWARARQQQRRHARGGLALREVS